MANGNPQKEEGYTPIANELLEAFLSFDFTKRQLTVLLCIARMTYGFSKKSDSLSTVQIANMTCIDRRKVSETMKELFDLNVIQKMDSGRISHGVFVPEIYINKNYLTWLTTGTKTAPVIDDENEHLNGYQKRDSPQNGTGTKTGLLTGTKTGRRRVPKQGTHKAIQKQENKYKQKTALPDGFSVSERVKKWAAEKGYKNLDSHLEFFILAVEKNNYKYANWDSAFMTAIRHNWAKLEDSKKSDVPAYQRNIV